jgi:hypothetical protein
VKLVPVVAGAADELAEGLRVGVGSLLEQPVEQQPSSSGGPPVEPEGELVEVVGQVLAADPVMRVPAVHRLSSEETRCGPGMTASRSLAR